jgi:hypothetical protein
VGARCGRTLWARALWARNLGKMSRVCSCFFMWARALWARNVGRPYGPHMGIWAQLEPMSPYPMRRPLFRPTRDGPTIRHVRVVWGEWRDFHSALLSSRRERCSSKSPVLRPPWALLVLTNRLPLLKEIWPPFLMRDGHDDVDLPSETLYALGSGFIGLCLFFGLFFGLGLIATEISKIH